VVQEDGGYFLGGDKSGMIFQTSIMPFESGLASVLIGGKDVDLESWITTLYSTNTSTSHATLLGNC